MLNAHARKTHTHEKATELRREKKRKLITSITAVYNHFKTTKPIYRGTSI